MFTTFLQLNFLEEILIIKRTFTILLNFFALYRAGAHFSKASVNRCVLFVAIPLKTICNKTTRYVRKITKMIIKILLFRRILFHKYLIKQSLLENPFRVTIVEGSVIPFTRANA